MARQVSKTCPWCAKQFLGHPNARFCSQVHKDLYHNYNNPRGKFAHLKGHWGPGIITAKVVREIRDERDHRRALGAAESGWDGHKGAF